MAARAVEELGAVADEGLVVAQVHPRFGGHAVDSDQQGRSLSEVPAAVDLLGSEHLDLRLPVRLEPGADVPENLGPPLARERGVERVQVDPLGDRVRVGYGTLPVDLPRELLERGPPAEEGRELRESPVPEEVSSPAADASGAGRR